MRAIVSVSWSHIPSMSVKRKHSQPDGRCATDTGFSTSYLWLQLLRDQVGAPTAIAKARNAIFQVAQDGAQNVILPHTKISVPLLPIESVFTD